MAEYPGERTLRNHEPKKKNLSPAKLNAVTKGAACALSPAGCRESHGGNRIDLPPGLLEGVGVRTQLADERKRQVDCPIQCPSIPMGPCRIVAASVCLCLWVYSIAPSQLSLVVCNGRGFKLTLTCSSSHGKLITIHGNFPFQAPQTFFVKATDVEITKPLLSCALLCKCTALQLAMGLMRIQGGTEASGLRVNFVVTASWSGQKCIFIERTCIGHGIHGRSCKLCKLRLWLMLLCPFWRKFVVVAEGNALVRLCASRCCFRRRT